MRSGVEIMEVMTDRKSGIFNYTVGELIEVLKEYPKDMPVIVSGYESGCENFYLPIVQKSGTYQKTCIGMVSFR